MSSTLCLFPKYKKIFIFRVIHIKFNINRLKLSESPYGKYFSAKTDTFTVHSRLEITNFFASCSKFRHLTIVKIDLKFVLFGPARENSSYRYLWYSSHFMFIWNQCHIIGIFCRLLFMGEILEGIEKECWAN